MKVTFDACNHHLPSLQCDAEAEDAAAGGARVKCPKCQTPFVVHADESAAPPAAAPRPGPKSGVTKPAAPRPKPEPPPEEEEAKIAEAVDEADDEAEEEGEAPVKAKKKIPLWVWIASGVGAFFLLCGCCPLGGWLAYSMMGSGGLLGANVSMTSYNKLKKGMTEDQVKAVMGGAPTLQQDVGPMHADTWKGSGDDFITVEFRKDGKAIAGGYQFTNGPAKMSGAGPLP